MVERRATTRVRAPMRSLLAALAILVACHGPEQSRPTQAANATAQPDPVGPLVAGEVVRGDAPLAGVRVSLSGTIEEVAISDEGGRFELVPVGEFATAPAFHVVLVEPDGSRHDAMLRNLGGRVDVRFECGDPLRVDLRDASPEQLAWIEVHAWAERERSEWLRAAKDDHAAHVAQWARIAAAIAEQPEPYRRGLMTTAQFSVGRRDPEAGLDRSEIAQRALDELGLEDPRWAIHVTALATAVYESGRWAELAPRLDALITEHPQPEVAALLALERYVQTSAEGPASEAAEIWRRWTERPALARTGIAPTMACMAPKRVLAPGQPLPELCVEDLAGGQLCTADLRGRPVVIEFWSTWCEGCRKAAATLRSARESLSGDDAPIFVSIDVYDDADTVRQLVASEPMPWRHGWVVEGEREAVRTRLQIEGIPTLVLVDAEGTIVASSPELRTENLLDHIQRMRGVH